MKLEQFDITSKKNAKKFELSSVNGEKAKTFFKSEISFIIHAMVNSYFHEIQMNAFRNKDKNLISAKKKIGMNNLKI